MNKFWFVFVSVLITSVNTLVNKNPIQSNLKSSYSQPKKAFLYAFSKISDII